MTSHKDPLDELIDTIISRILSGVMFDFSTDDLLRKEAAEEVRRTILYEAYRIGMEAIGEDDDVITIIQSVTNSVRREQRQRLSELTGQSNE